MGCLSWMQLSYVTFTHSADVEVQPPAEHSSTIDEALHRPSTLFGLLTPLFQRLFTDVDCLNNALSAPNSKATHDFVTTCFGVA